jgi:hypothetical protein
MAAVTVVSARERGPYLTPNRALQLERHIAALEAKLSERIDRQDRELARLRSAQVNTLRAIAGAFMQVLRDQLGEGGDR